MLRSRIMRAALVGAALVAATTFAVPESAGATELDQTAIAVWMAWATPTQVIMATWSGTTAGPAMVAIATRESGLSCAPPLTGQGYGLFQLAGHERMAASMGVTVEQLKTDCWANARVARALFDACGLGPWSRPFYCRRP